MPVYNEEENLQAVIDSIPQKISTPATDKNTSKKAGEVKLSLNGDGLDEKEIDESGKIVPVDILVIDDGSTDQSWEIIKKNLDQGKIKYVIRNEKNLGLARTFQKGVNFAKSEGYDILVNLDGDNQYDAREIGKLIAPILEPVIEERADFVLGQRNLKTHYRSGWKLRLHQLGNWYISKVIKQDLVDPPSGFRAYSRKAIEKIQLQNNYSHVFETLIQFSSLGLTMMSVPINSFRTLRPSRLYRTTFDYVWNSGVSILKSQMFYRK